MGLHIFFTIFLVIKIIFLYTSNMTTYTTFKRTCKNFGQFGSARKTIQDTDLSYETAKERCKEFNENRAPAQIKRGTYLEFMKTEDLR